MVTSAFPGDPLFKLVPKVFAGLPVQIIDPWSINAVRSQEPPLAVVEVLNPRIVHEELTGKFIVL